MSFDDMESFRSFSYDDELAKARWYHDDLNDGGWREVTINPRQKGANFWVKTFPDQEIPTKTLIKFKMPISAKQFADVLSPRNMEYRKKWDNAFIHNDILEEYPENGGHVITSVAPLPWPLSDREFVLFVPPIKEVEWYGKIAFHVIYINAWHPSKPANVGPYTRATNGGNFYLAVPDERDPDIACTVFGLSHNRSNGWIPNCHVEWLMARTVPKAFVSLFESIVEGHKMFFEGK